MATFGVNKSKFAIGTTPEEDELVIVSITLNIDDPDVERIRENFINAGKHLTMVQYQKLQALDPEFSLEVKRKDDYDDKTQKSINQFGPRRAAARKKFLEQCCKRGGIEIPTDATACSQDRDKELVELRATVAMLQDGLRKATSVIEELTERVNQLEKSKGTFTEKPLISESKHEECDDQRPGKFVAASKSQNPDEPARGHDAQRFASSRDGNFRQPGSHHGSSGNGDCHPPLNSGILQRLRQKIKETAAVN